MQGGILTEAGFVTENQRPVAALGFFLSIGHLLRGGYANQKAPSEKSF